MPMLRNKMGWRIQEQKMTLFEISIRYRAQAEDLWRRLEELRTQLPGLPLERRGAMESRIRMLTDMWREARDLAVLCERYYERGYCRNGKYTL